MPKRNSHLRGIVVVADSQEQVQDHFRAVASGNYKVLESLDGQMAIATSDTVGMQLLNPLNGEEMVVVPDDEKHEMVAVASADNGEAEAFYVTCASGCGSHVIADQQDLLDKCPSCASDLPSLEDDALKTNAKKPEILLAVAGSREEVAVAYRALATGACETYAAECDGVMVVSNQPLKFDIYKGSSVQTIEGYVPQTAVASAEGTVDAHYLTTASDANQMHILCSDESPLFCPESSGCLIDPANDELAASFNATASDEEEEEDEEDEEDFDEEEEDEDDEEEEEDEEDEDEEEEDDDDLSLSLASTGKKKGGVRRKEKATASSAKPSASEMVAIAASYVAYAADEMTDATVELAYAGSIQGQATWLAFHNGIPFAKATAANAENPATFADASFGRAFKAIAAEQGVQAAISQLRFEEIRPVLNVEKAVQAQIETGVQEQTAVLAEASARDVSELGERYNAALATAAQGINRGFFKDIQNPVRVALANTMQDLGIQDGEELIQKAFVDNADTYNQLLIAKANEIVKYDLTVQNQLATAINDIQEENVQVATAASLSVGRPVAKTVPAQKGFESTASSAQPDDDFGAKLKNLRLFK